MTQAVSVFANPGQAVRLVTQVVDGYGDRVDGYVPEVMSVYMPDLTASTGFPLAMTRLSTGLYYATIQLPTGTSAVGTFIASVRYTDPSNNLVWELFQINVALPFGNATFTPL